MEKKQRRSGRWDIFILGIVAVLFSLPTFLNCSGVDKRTPEEIAKIDSMAVELTAAPATSVIRYKDGDMDIIERSNEEWVYFILNTGRDDSFRTRPTRVLATEIEAIFPPSDPCYSVMLQNAVEKITAFMVKRDTVGTKECPQATEQTLETNVN